LYLFSSCSEVHSAESFSLKIKFRSDIVSGRLYNVAVHIKMDL